MKNIAGLMKQATQMQARMKEAQEKLAALSVTGEAGAGLVQLTLTGKGDLGGIKIAPKILNPEDAETLQDLICEAYGAAREKIRVANEEEMKKVTGGLSLPPGMELPFG